MKKLLLMFIMCLGAFSVNAQHARLNAYTSYVFDDAVDSYYSNTSYFNGQVDGGFQWGVGLEYILPAKGSKQYGIELSYLRQDTHAPLEYVNDISGNLRFTNFDLGMNFIMLGGNAYTKVNPKIEPFGGIAAGIALLDLTNPTTNSSGNTEKFSWLIRAGANIYATPKVALKLQGTLLSSVQAVGGGLYFGTGGAGAGVSTYSSMLQFVLGGGLSFNFE